MKPDDIFTLKEEDKNGTEGMSRWTTDFLFTAEWLWQEVC